jgi:hypothetical protein
LNDSKLPPDEDGKPTVVERPSGREARSSDVRAAGTASPGAAGARSNANALRSSIEPVSEPAKRSSRKSLSGNRYASGDEIGRGGMGRVVEATDTLLERRVAVKEALTTDAELLRRFARETKITAKLEHPSIVPVYDAGEANGAPFYVMRRVTGRPLSELIRDAPTLAERLALVPHVLAAAQAIAHAHQRGIIHRDIKPANILVGELGETVVIDWGLAKVVGEPDDDGDIVDAGASSSLRTRIGAVFGTPGFMAPEQLRGDDVRLQGDVYALGASLYNLLAAAPPHYTDDSTQMMKLAKHAPPAAIGELVPGVPAELSTIVDTALEYDTARRYRDAGAFAEELKRFLAGQLVASHRYSAIARLVRFIRQNRATVAIAGAALLVVFGVGAFALSRVVEERDRAEAALEMADERANELILSRARTLLDTNPTAAIASLKMIAPHSKVADEARAIANAARVRGVAWAMKGPDDIVAYGALDPAGARLAIVTVHGAITVWDLQARKKTWEVELRRGVTIRFILGGRALLVGGAGPTRIFDAATGVEQPATGLPELVHITVDEAGNTLVGFDAQKRAVRVDLASRATTVLPVEGATELVQSPNGNLAGAITPQEVVVFDRAAKPIVRYPHAHTVLRIGLGDTRAAIFDDVNVLEAYLDDPQPAFRELSAIHRSGHRPLNLDYLNERLFVISTDSRVLGEAGKKELREIGRMEFTGGVMDRFGRDYMVTGTDGRRIHYIDGAKLSSFNLPISLRAPRLVGRRDQSRVIAVGDGAIVVTELGTYPRSITVPDHRTTVFVTEGIALSSNSFTFDFLWYDLATGSKTPFEIEGIGQLATIERHDGRIAIAARTPTGRNAVVFAAGNPTPVDRVTREFDKLQLVDGGGVVYSIGNTVYGGTGTHVELFRTNGNVTILVRLAKHKFAAVSEHELVRYDLSTKLLERLALEPGLEVAYAAHLLGDTMIARGEKLFRWGKSLEPFAEFGAGIEAMFSIDRGILVLLVDGSSMYLDAKGAIRRLASARGAVVASEGRVVVPGQFFYDIIELPSLARWSMPIVRTRDSSQVSLDIAPSGNAILEKRHDGKLWFWQMPRRDEPLESVLAATNLTEDRNGVMVWPWQKPD